MAPSQSPREMLLQQLESARRYDSAVREQLTQGDPVRIRHTGQAISSAYEHLRNAADYADEGLVLQKAIKRFYKRTLFIVKRKPEQVGNELIGELILAGYIPDGSVGKAAVRTISGLAADYMATYEQLRAAHVPPNQAREWVLAVLSVRTRDLLNPHMYDLALASFVYQYLLVRIPRERLVRSPQEESIFEGSLYTAIHQTLLKSDPDVVLTDLLRIHDQTTENIDHYIAWNKHAGELFTAGLTMRLRRIVQKNIAPFHILRQLAASNPDLAELLPEHEQFMQAYGHQISTEYNATGKRLNNGVLKSIVFLFLTKVVIGGAIEVPFDRYFIGHIVLMPLIINLLFPPLYMASIRFGLVVPSGGNASAMSNFMDKLLFSDHIPEPILPRRTAPYPFIARFLYTLLALVPFVITIIVLKQLYFNPLQMVIFFVFFSTASFLGYRLGNMIRELKMTSHDQALLTIFLDLFYLPFIWLGQWLSSKYSKLNVVGEFLDLVIELPLKTVIGLVRQSVRFLNEKHQELY